MVSCDNCKVSFKKMVWDAVYQADLLHTSIDMPNAKKCLLDWVLMLKMRGEDYMSRRRGGIVKRLNLETLFCGLPTEDNNQYTVELKKMVLDNDFLNKETEIENYLLNKQNRYRFAAFYSLLIVCREYNNYSKYNEYVEKYATQFSQVKLYKIVMSTYYRNKGILGDLGAYRNAIRFAEEACTMLPDNLAVKHHFAELIVLADEEGTNIHIKTINKAIERLDDVMYVNPNHAKYYCTLGRLFACLGDYNQGIKNVRKALDLERGDNKDSLIRIGQYNYYLLQIKMLIENNKVDSKMGKFNSDFEQMKNDLDSMKTQYLEYLAFFSSVLAFVLITVNVVVSVNNFNKCTGIVLMFAGALVVVFGVFRMLLYYSSSIKFSILKIIFSYVTGFLFLIAGFVIGNQLYVYWL